MSRYKTILNWAALISVIILMVSMCSCSASWHIRQAQRKDPTLFQAKEVQRIDTVIIPLEKVETLLKFRTDTLITYVDTTSAQPVEIRYKYIKKLDSIYLSADCPDAEIITKEIIKTNTITIKPTLWQQIQWSVYIIAALALFIILKPKT